VTPYAAAATQRGRHNRPTLKVGICGEHGGDPSSVEFCQQVGPTYSSLRGTRIELARERTLG
jgi:pyruvate,orthophosphate dikinase